MWSKAASQCSYVYVCRRVDTNEAHAERAVLREQLDRAYDSLRLKRSEERDMVQDVAQVGRLHIIFFVLCKMVDAYASHNCDC